MEKGKLIVLYGINNLGKTTQAKILVERLNERKFTAEYLKYPIYALSPTGPRLNNYLRKDNPEGLTSKEAQELYAQNRTDYSDSLESKLNNGIIIVAEDYWGTGVAWGIGAGVDKEYLLELNKPFQNEDLAILIYGNRFSSGLEDGHLHEGNSDLTRVVAQAHEDLAKQFNWSKVNANASIQEVADKIWIEVQKVIE